jgi:hypothetical protein
MSMSAATTIAPALKPALKPVRPVAPPPRIEPQHMQALARANKVRLARAALKRDIGASRRDVVEIVRTCPWEAESMTLAELLSSQRRWGKARSRKLIVQAGLTETKRLGTLTERQRGILAAALEAKATC